MAKLFVYGTLAPGQPNHHILESLSGLWQKATIRGTLVEKGWGAELGCPGIVPSESGEVVSGYLFSSDDLPHYWDMLDRFEGEEYRRVDVLVQTDDGEGHHSFVYALKDV